MARHAGQTHFGDDDKTLSCKVFKILVLKWKKVALLWKKINVDLKRLASSRSHKRPGLGSGPTLLSLKASKCQTLKKRLDNKKMEDSAQLLLTVTALNLAFGADCSSRYI